MLPFLIHAQSGGVAGLGTLVDGLGAQPDQLGLELERGGSAFDFEAERTPRADLDHLIELHLCATGGEICDPHWPCRAEHAGKSRVETKSVRGSQFLDAVGSAGLA